MQSLQVLKMLDWKSRVLNQLDDYKKIRSPDPADGKVVPLYNPRTQQWQEHFRWNHDFSRIVRLTAVGRATVQALKLNRPGLINIRNALFIIGWHPPTD